MNWLKTAENEELKMNVIQQLQAQLSALETELDILDQQEPEDMNSEAYEDWADAHEDLEDQIDDIRDRLDMLG